MLRLTVSFLVCLALAASPAAAEKVDDPTLADARVGDWIEWRVVMPPEVKMESTTKQTVTKVTDAEVTIEVENQTKMNGNPIPPQKLPAIVRPRKIEKADADKRDFVQGKQSEAKKTGGDGKEYRCTVYENDVQGKKSLTYICKDLPLGGLVNTSIDGITAMEMIGWGRGK